MKLKSMERWASYLALVILGAILWYGSAPRKILVGAAYLVSAAFLGFFCLFNVLTVKTRLKKSPLSQSMWLLQTRAQVMLLVAWQLAITGLLNIWSSDTSGFLGIFLLSNVLVAVCIFTWDRLISIADNPSQDGGAQSLSSPGHRRSRRLFFWAFFVYPLLSLVLAGLMLFVKGKAYPAPFHPPQLCLLLDALFSAGAAGLIFQRYRGVSANQTHKATFILVGLLVVGVAIGSQLFVGWNPYTNLLSTFILLCATLCAYLLWQASNSSLPGTPKSALPTASEA
jgi:hypothetical protein